MKKNDGENKDSLSNFIKSFIISPTSNHTMNGHKALHFLLKIEIVRSLFRFFKTFFLFLIIIS